jgi:hypothetical protein
MPAPQPQPEKILAKVRDLIALAGSPNENEARNAAFLAVQKIREHGVTLHLGEPVRQPSEPQTASSEMGSPRVIVSKFSGRCRTCGESYAVGDQIRWMRGKGAAHVTCGWS